MATLANISVPYKTEWGSYSAGGDAKVATSTETYWVAFADQQQFCIEVMGEDTTVNTPVQSPYWSNQYASSFAVETRGYDGANPHRYERAYVTVTYKTMTYETSGDDAYLSEKLKFSANMLTLPGSAYKFADATPVDTGVGRVVPEVEYSVTWAKIAAIPTSTILSCIGKVNSTTFKGCNAGTVLFAGGDSDNQTSIGLASKKSIQYAFLYRPVEWNKFLNPTTGNWATITTASGAFVYESTDLNVLI